MDVERLVVRLLADSSGYDQVMNRTMARLTDFAAYATATLGRTAIELATNYERAGIAFEVMAGSASEGQKILQQVANLALETPFSAEELIRSAKQVKAFGFETKDIIPILSRLGDVSSATGTDMDRLILAFGQVRTTGRLMGQELRQFTNAGVPILENLAAVLGVSVAQVPNLVRQGRIGFDDVAKAFNRMTSEGGLFHGMMERVNAETLSGRWQNFKENLQVSARNLGLAAVEGLGLKNVLTSLSAGGKIDFGMAKDFFQDVRRGLQALGFVAEKAWQGIKDLWKAIKDAADVSWEWAKRNKELIGTFAAAFLIVKSITTAIWLLNAAYAAIVGFMLLFNGAVIISTLAVAALIAELSAMGALDGIAGILGHGFGQMAKDFTQAWGGIKDAIGGGDLQLAWNIALNGLSLGWKTLLITMEGAWDRFAANLKTKFSVGGDIQSGLKLMANDAMAFVEKQLGGDQNKIEGERRQIMDEILKKNLDFNTQRKSVTDMIDKGVADQIAALPERNVQNQLVGQAKTLNDPTVKAEIAAITELWNGPKAQREVENLFNSLRAVLGPAAEGLISAHMKDGKFFPSDSLRTPSMTEAFRRTGELSQLPNSDRAVDKLLKDTGGMLSVSMDKLTQTMKDKISEPLQLSADVLIAARDLQKEFVKGITPIQEYTIQIKKLDEAFNGPLRKFGIPGRAVGAGISAGLSMTPFGALGHADIFQGVINQNEKNFGDFQAFEKLRKATAVDRGNTAGPAQLEGSREAQETINRSNTMLVSVEQQVLQTLLTANIIAQEMNTRQAKVVEALANIEAKGGPTLMRIP